MEGLVFTQVGWAINSKRYFDIKEIQHKYLEIKAFCINTFILKEKSLEMK